MTACRPRCSVSAMANTVTNSRKHWSADENALLLMLLKQHTPFDKIAELLKRPVVGVRDHVHRCHREAYAASGHPSYQPAKSEALRRRAKTKPAPTLALVPQDVPSIADVVDLLTKIDARLTKIAQDLGVQS